MKIKEFVLSFDLIQATELNKVIYLGFYLIHFENRDSFTIIEVSDLLIRNGFSKINPSRLKQNLKKSRDVISGSVEDTFRLSPKKMNELLSLSLINETNELVDCIGAILPLGLYQNTRGYIIKIGDQINASYENNIFDGCVVLMRRLIELLLIMSYDKLQRGSDIRNDKGDLCNLSRIIKITVSVQPFNLSKGSNACIDTFRLLGNFSAHTMQYNCSRSDIDKVKLQYRVLIEELLYSSGLLK